MTTCDKREDGWWAIPSTEEIRQGAESIGPYRTKQEALEDFRRMMRTVRSRVWKLMMRDIERQVESIL